MLGSDCVCQDLVCAHVRVVVVAGCHNYSLHGPVAAVAAVAADNHRGQAVGYDLLLLLLWEHSCHVVGEIALLVASIVGFAGIAGI